MSETDLGVGREAAARGDWQSAYDALMRADREGPLAPADLALLADVAYAAGHLDVTIDLWERAHAEHLRAGDAVAAAGAATRVAMHLLFDTALMSPVRGWVKRAERLLEGREETPVRAWLAVLHGYERLLSGDAAAAGEWARQAIDVGARCNPAAAAIGRLVEARALVLAGEVRRGLALLDEAAVATVSGELDPLSTGVLYCELVCALQALTQYDMAEQWTRAMEQWRHGTGVGSIHGRCRVHRAEILRLRGANEEAETEALLACEELRPYLRREFGWPLTELGRIRLRKGDLEGAEEAFSAALEAGWDPQPGIALVHLERGDVTLAASSIRDALERPSQVPSKEQPPNTELRRAPLLDAQIEIAIAAGDLARARWAADELGRIAAIYGSTALSASASAGFGRLRLAEGDTLAARRSFEDAIHRWAEVGAPFETAVARLGLAEAYRAERDEVCARRESRIARATFEQIGATRWAERAGRASGAAGDAATESDGNVFTREGEYWSVTFERRTIRVRDVTGLRHLSRLLAEPGREWHVLDLAGAERGSSAEPSIAERTSTSRRDLGDAGVLLDARAKAAYRRRLDEVDEDIEDANATGDVERAARADAERGILIRELSRAVGLGGRDRRAGASSERARVSVTRAVRAAIDRLRAHDAALGEHLDRAIRTGSHCVYLPEPRTAVRWKIR